LENNLIFHKKFTLNKQFPTDFFFITIPKHEFFDVAVDLLGSGKYDITATVNLADGSEMTCLEVSLELA
jgi:hypothetical protein